MRFVYEIPKPSEGQKKEKEKKDKKVGQSSGRGLCETSKSSDSVDLHLKTL